LFNPVLVIKKKRDGGVLSSQEVSFFIQGFARGDIPDYQMSAFLMSVFFRGMTEEETAHLTQAMLASGIKLDLSRVKKPKIDKHSTGGVGDKTSLILAPLLASLGVAVPMISGRGLGHTGGTADKLEAIPGFQTQVTHERFEELVATIGVSMITQSSEIAPADKRMYALRDVTATVDCIPLIVGSILSKKLAEDFDGLVLDVKTGNGAFMKDPRKARELAKAMVKAAKKAGKNARALVTDMSQPLGATAGNAIEVNECVEFLRQGPRDPAPEKRLEAVTIALAQEMLIMARAVQKKKTSAKEAMKEIRAVLASGKAYAKFLELVSLQGGNTATLDKGLPLAPTMLDWLSEKSGFLGSIDTEAVGMILVSMGGGRMRAEDSIDPSVGIRFFKQLGDTIKKGEPILRIYARNAAEASVALEGLKEAVRMAKQRPKIPKLIRERI
jgi:pyrimidine-nucleoside phosphorylase